MEAWCKLRFWVRAIKQNMSFDGSRLKESPRALKKAFFVRSWQSCSSGIFRGCFNSLRLATFVSNGCKNLLQNFHMSTKKLYGLRFVCCVLKTLTFTQKTVLPSKWKHFCNVNCCHFASIKIFRHVKMPMRPRSDIVLEKLLVCFEKRFGSNFRTKIWTVLWDISKKMRELLSSKILVSKIQSLNSTMVFKVAWLSNIIPHLDEFRDIAILYGFDKSDKRSCQNQLECKRRIHNLECRVWWVSFYSNVV